MNYPLLFYFLFWFGCLELLKVDLWF